MEVARAFGDDRGRGPVATRNTVLAWASKWRETGAYRRRVLRQRAAI